MNPLDDMLLNNAKARLLTAIETEIAKQIGDNWHVWSAWPGTRLIALAVMHAVEQELEERKG